MLLSKVREGDIIGNTVSESMIAAWLRGFKGKKLLYFGGKLIQSLSVEL
jgi:hypothetical protein